jgi:hypothetical protein
MNFLLVKTQADDHLYSVFIRTISKILVDSGHKAGSIHVDAATTNYDVLKRIHEFEANVVISFSSFLGSVEADTNLSLYDAAGVQFIGWQFDHPIYSVHHLMNDMKNRWTLYPNKNHAAFLSKMGVRGRESIMLAGGRPMSEAVLDYNAREIPVLIAATWNGIPKRTWDELPEGLLKDLLDKIADHTLHDPEASLMTAFDKACAELGLSIDLDASVVRILTSILTHVRHRDRLAAVEAIVDSGVPLTIVGAGWRGHFGDRPNVSYRPEVSFENIQNLYNHSKVVVNLNAANGGCERAIYAMLAGAAVVSDFSSSYSTSGVNSDCIRYFDRARPDAISSVIGDLLEGDGAAIAENGYRCAMGSQLWPHRLAWLIDRLTSD